MKIPTMRRALALFLICVCGLLCAVRAGADNLIPQGDSDMSKIESWFIPYNGTITTQTRDQENGECLCFTRGKIQSWSSPGLDLLPLLRKDLQQNGSGEYELTFDFMATNTELTEEIMNLNCLLRAGNRVRITTTTDKEGTEFRCGLGKMKGVRTNQWYHFSNTVSFYDDETSDTGQWMLCFDSFPEELQSFYLDNVRLCRVNNASDGTVGEVSITALDGGQTTAPTPKAADGEKQTEPPATAEPVQTAQQPVKPEARPEKELYSPKIIQNAIITGGATVGLIAIGTAIRIRLNKKKG